MWVPRRRRSTPDPWDAALRRHFREPAGPAGAGAPPPPPPPPGPRARLPWVVAAAAVAAVILALASGLVWTAGVAQENHEVGGEWRDRSQALAGVVADRTRALNRQTARLNAASTRLRRAERAVRRSEADVAELETRQRELSAEKAAVEDQRAQLEGERAFLVEKDAALSDVANALMACNRSMSGVLEAVVSGWYVDDLDVRRLGEECSAADAAVGDYIARYGP